MRSAWRLEILMRTFLTMINILPPAEKNKVSEEKKKRVILVFLFFSVIFSILISGTMYGVTRRGVKILEEEMSDYGKSKSEMVVIDEKANNIKEFNAILNQISRVNEDSIGIDKLYLKVKDKIPSEIEIQQLRLNRVAEGYEVVLSGRASVWQDLTSLEDSLSYFSEVNFSSDSWKQVEDIDFLVKFIVNGKEE